MTTPEDAHGSGRPDDELAGRFGTALVRLNKMHAALSASLSKAGIDKASFVLLANLAQMGPSRASALAEAVFSDPSTVSRQVAGLVKDGLVERRADPDDGRASVLAVTDNGLSLLHERRRVRNAALARLFSDWSTHDWTTFVEHFERFVEGYEKALPDFIAEGGQGPRSEGEK